MSGKQITFSNKAFVKIQLHAAKYPHCAVNGLLLACKETYIKEKVVLVVDAVPLFHHCIQLTPMLEVAFTNVDAHCKSQQLQIVGYYEAHEHLKAALEPSLFATKVADNMLNYFDDSKLVVIDNKEIPAEQSIRVFDRMPDSKWKPTKSEVAFEGDCVEIVEHLIQRKVERDLCDFDNHLDDITQDWLNPNINQLVIMN